MDTNVIIITESKSDYYELYFYFKTIEDILWTVYALICILIILFAYNKPVRIIDNGFNELGHARILVYLVFAANLVRVLYKLIDEWNLHTSGKFKDVFTLRGLFLLLTVVISMTLLYINLGILKKASNNTPCTPWYDLVYSLEGLYSFYLSLYIDSGYLMSKASYVLDYSFSDEGLLGLVPIPAIPILWC